MYRIGLAGGMGSGKSVVASMLAERGAIVVEADSVARELVATDPEVIKGIVGAFGTDVLDVDGELDRRALAREAFASNRSLAALNAITHPPLVGALVRRTEELEREHPDGVLVIDAALLVQWDVLDLFDVVLVVEAPVETRVARLVEGGFAEEDARARIASQLPDEEMRAAADAVIVNDGSLEELERAVDGFWSSLPVHKEDA
jgi:dephospho-CoA kinase